MELCHLNLILVVALGRAIVTMDTVFSQYTVCIFRTFGRFIVWKLESQMGSMVQEEHKLFL